MFGLQSDYGNELQRHRYFEVFPHILIMQPPCNHNGLSAIGVYGGGQHPARGTRVNGSGASQIDDDFGIEQRKKAMNISWMTNAELTQAIPPAYTEFIGKKLLEILK
jgi:DNA (cytosine-5)-methyltransferase 1